MLIHRAQAPRARAGLSLLELLIAVALVGAVGAIMIPAVKARLDSAQASAVIDNLTTVRAAIVSYRDDVGRYPSHLRQLQSKPGVGTTPLTDICAATVPAWQIAKWNGPYVANPVTASGININGVNLNDALIRDVLDGEYLYVRFSGLNSVMADEIDIAFDGAAGRLSGAIWYTPASCTDATCLVRFYVAISGC